MSIFLLGRASRSHRTSRVAFIVTALCVSGACKKNDGETAAGGYVQGQVGPSAAGAGSMAMPTQGGAPGVMPASAGAAPLPATVPATPAAPTGPTAQRLDASAATAVQPILTALVKDNVQSGAKPIGAAVVGNFGQGQTLEFPVELQPNKCYTVVATGLPPVTELNVQLELTTVIPGMAPVLAVDPDRGATAVLGKKAACYRWMFGVIPAPGKVVLQVTAGSGLVAAQVYEK